MKWIYLAGFFIYFLWQWTGSKLGWVLTTEVTVTLKRKKKKKKISMPLGHLKTYLGYTSPTWAQKVIENQRNTKWVLDDAYPLWLCQCLARYVSSTWNVVQIFKYIHALLNPDLLGKSVSTWADSRCKKRLTTPAFLQFFICKKIMMRVKWFIVPSVIPLPQEVLK